MSQPTLRPKILIADDEKLIADTLVMILNRGGFEARAVYSCEDALAMASTFQPDLLISDVLMADCNGIDAAIQIRAMLPEIHVFLVSGQTSTADILANSEARDLGFEILTKPVHPRDLLNKLQSVLPVRYVA